MSRYRLVVLFAYCSPQQTTANLDQIGEVEEMIQSFGAVLGHSVCNQDGEEKARSEVLGRFALPRSGNGCMFLTPSTSFAGGWLEFWRSLDRCPNSMGS